MLWHTELFGSCSLAQAAVNGGGGGVGGFLSNVSSFPGEQALSVSVQGFEKEHHIRLQTCLG